jgi:hypothetical protein
LSYCRFSDESDVYLYESVSGGFRCCGCCLYEEPGITTPIEAFGHLWEHRKAGEQVPERAFQLLAKKIAEVSE